MLEQYTIHVMKDINEINLYWVTYAHLLSSGKRTKPSEQSCVFSADLFWTLPKHVHCYTFARILAILIAGLYAIRGNSLLYPISIKRNYVCFCEMPPPPLNSEIVWNRDLKQYKYLLE